MKNKIKKQIYFFIKLIRIVLIKLFINNNMNNSKLLFLDSSNYIKKIKKKNEQEEHFANIRNNLNDFQRIFFSHQNPLFFLKNRNKNYLESFFKIRDIYYAFKVQNKQLNTLFKRNPKYHKLEFKIYYLMAKRILKRIKPKIILLTCSYGPKYPFIVAAKEFGIKTIELQHGMINQTHSGYIIAEKYKNKYLLPDYLITYGNYEKKLLTTKSIWSKNQIVPLGCPRYDFLKNNQINKIQIKDKYNIPSNKKILFWPTQTHDRILSKNGENELNAETIFSTINKKKDWFLIIKFHPNENNIRSKKFYKKYKEKFGLKRCKIWTHEKARTYDCIALSDAVILKYSTVGKEAILMNKPIINLELRKTWDLSEFKKLKSSLIVKNNKDLDNFLNKTETKKFYKLFKQERNKYIEEHFNNFGYSTNKIIEFIENELQK